VGKLLTLISKPAGGPSGVRRDSEEAESLTAGATVEEGSKQDLTKPTEKDSKSKPLDTRQQGSLF